MNILCIAGFLGSGKTTVLLEVARAMAEDGATARRHRERDRRGRHRRRLRARAGPARPGALRRLRLLHAPAGLVETLRAVESRYEPDWVIIEPTGLAAPGDILGVVVDHCPSVDAIRVLSIADAERWPMLLEVVEPLVTAQLAAADVVAVNKVDAVDEDELAAVLRERARAGAQGVRPAGVRGDRRRHEAAARSGRVTHEHGHDHLRHLPAGTPPAVFAARADVVFAPPVHADQLEQVVSRFCAALSGGLADAGCSLVGHVKGTLR